MRAHPISDQQHLDDAVQAVAADLLKCVGSSASSTTAAAQVRVTPSKQSYVHSVGVVEIPGTQVRCFAKAKKPQYVGQDLRREAEFLSAIAPSITLENPLLRTPAFIGYYAAQDLLLMELVQGMSLKQHLFDVSRFTIADMSRYVELAGEWLGRLHRSNRQDATTHPVQEVLDYFRRNDVHELFRRCSLEACYSEMVRYVEAFLWLNPNLRRKVSVVHGEFTPLHVLVSGESIYVVDFGSSKIGLPHDDLALFCAFWDSLMPWRIVAGAVRLRFANPKKLFLDAYFAHAGWTLNVADELLMRLARMKALIRLMLSWDHTMMVHPGLMKSVFWKLWLLPRFAAACRQDLQQLRNYPISVLDPHLEIPDKQVCANRPA